MKTIALLAAMVTLASCGSVYNTVSSDYDRSVDFTRYKSFAWLPDKADTASSPYNNEIVRNNIRNYFGLCMSDRGYKVDLDKPDLLLQLVIVNAKRQKTISPLPPSYFYQPYYYGSHYYSPYLFAYYYRSYPGYGYTYPTTQKVDYVNGAITLNLIDAATKKLVWSGTAIGDIYDPSEINSDLHPAVHRILEQYPVQPLAVKRRHKVK